MERGDREALYTPLTSAPKLKEEGNKPLDIVILLFLATKRSCTCRDWLGGELRVNANTSLTAVFSITEERDSVAVIVLHQEVLVATLDAITLSKDDFTPRGDTVWKYSR